MRFLYGEQNILRALDEAEFWKHQEAEHADLIPVVTPSLETNYVQSLEHYSSAFRLTLAEVVKYIESVTRSRGSVGRALKVQMLELIQQCIDQSQSFTELLEDMLQNSHAVRADKTSQVLLYHMIRESKYFIGIDQLIIHV